MTDQDPQVLPLTSGVVRRRLTVAVWWSALAWPVLALALTPLLLWWLATKHSSPAQRTTSAPPSCRPTAPSAPVSCPGKQRRRLPGKSSAKRRPRT
ncbi:hypothetical protein AB0C59_07015 [Streptomyces sp. NPDC048664]|uniref:hypothetical protein n=1 Tax=Streptomyces sp. NPDC048664 TaxID=3154505 RepID=UPI00342585C6